MSKNESVSVDGAEKNLLIRALDAYAKEVVAVGKKADKAKVGSEAAKLRNSIEDLKSKFL